MNTPAGMPLYVTSLDELFWGGILMAITMVMHAAGMLMVLRVNLTLKNRLGTKNTILVGMIPLVIASWQILFVHLLEVLVWACFFLWKGAFSNGSIAYYFSLNEYTTVGSDFSLPLHWRLLEGLIATTGLLTFAWSTGILFTLAQEFQDKRLQLDKQRHLKLPVGKDTAGK